MKFVWFLRNQAVHVLAAGIAATEIVLLSVVHFLGQFYSILVLSIVYVVADISTGREDCPVLFGKGNAQLWC